MKRLYTCIVVSTYCIYFYVLKMFFVGLLTLRDQMKVNPSQSQLNHFDVITYLFHKVLRSIVVIQAIYIDHHCLKFKFIILNHHHGKSQFVHVLKESKQYKNQSNQKSQKKYWFELFFKNNFHCQIDAVNLMRYPQSPKVRKV